MNLVAWAERNGVARVTRTVAEHRDRFCRLCSEYVRTALLAHGRELVVVDPAEVGRHAVDTATTADAEVA